MRRNSLEPALVGTPVSTTNPSPSPNPERKQELLEKHPFSRKLHAKCLRVTMVTLTLTLTLTLNLTLTLTLTLTRSCCSRRSTTATRCTSTSSLTTCSRASSRRTSQSRQRYTPAANTTSLITSRLWGTWGRGGRGGGNVGWGFGVGGNVGGVGSRDVVRAALAVEYLAIPALRTTYYYSLGHLHTLRTLRTLAHNRAGSALGQVAQAVRAAAGRREGRAQGPPEGDKPWRQGEGGGPLQCMSRRLETLWSP